jgi:tRNA(Ile)-lysidine synthase
MPRPSPATDLVLRTLTGVYQRERLVGRSLLLAVSGGADSVALLVGSAQVAAPLGLRREVGTLDHGLRPEAGAEVQAVLALAARLGVPAHARALALAPDAPGL